MIRRIATRTAIVPAVLAVAAAAAMTLTTAPAAHAVGGNTKCTSDANRNGKVNTSNVNLRSGPGSSYRSYGQLTKGAKLYIDCVRQTSTVVQPWLYIKVNSGAHAGQRGWIRDDLVNWPL